MDRPGQSLGARHQFGLLKKGAFQHICHGEGFLEIHLVPPKGDEVNCSGTGWKKQYRQCQVRFRWKMLE
jgi:hypothetical protein